MTWTGPLLALDYTYKVYTVKGGHLTHIGLKIRSPLEADLIQRVREPTERAI